MESDDAMGSVESFGEGRFPLACVEAKTSTGRQEGDDKVSISNVENCETKRSRHGGPLVKKTCAGHAHSDADTRVLKRPLRGMPAEKV